MSRFASNLATGQLGESLIARWCMSRGNSLIPVYEKEIDTGKGPRFFSPEGQFVAHQHALSNLIQPFKSLSFSPRSHARNQAWDNQHEVQKISAAGAGSYE